MGEVHISARVSGNRNKTYQQDIYIYDDLIETDFFATCTCPVSDDCKHIVAVLLSYLDGKQHSQTTDPVETWLGALTEASLSSAQPQNTPSSDSRYILLYILQPDDDFLHRLQVTTQKVRLLKRGGYGKPSAYPLEDVQHNLRNVAFTPVDLEMAQILSSKDSYYYYDNDNSYPLQGELGELVLNKIIASGKCHWQTSDSPPLSPGATQTIQFNWKNIPGGKRLESTLQQPDTTIWCLQKLWYIDTNNAVAGLIQHDLLTSDQVLASIDAPLIPESRFEEISLKLLTDVPEYNLPTPVEVDIQRIHIKEEKPTIRLRLSSQEDQLTDTWEHSAQILFQYGSVELQNDTTQKISTWHKDNIIYTVERDLAIETAAMDELHDRGLFLHEQYNHNNLKTSIWLAPGNDEFSTAMRWHHFIENDIPQLQAQNWDIHISNSFKLSFEEADDWHANLDESDSDWFSLSIGVAIDGEQINLLPTLVQFLSQKDDPEDLRQHLNDHNHVMFRVDSNRWIKLPSERLLSIFDTLIELYDHEPLNDDGTLALSRHQGIQIGDLLNDPNLQWHGARELQELTRQLKDFQGIKHINQPEGFNTELRPYQQQGLNWLQFLGEFGFNGILADDMGLGKTVQTLAHLLLEKKQGRMQQPSLIIAPTSLMGNWRREAAHFAKELRVLVLHGAERREYFDQISDHDVILTTYPLLRHDKQHLMEHSFHYVILDEAQYIKNPKSQTSQVACQLKSAHRLCLTGTPMENHLGELWSMFHFLMPGFLGKLERFNRLFRHPIERRGDTDRQLQLSKRLKPFLLRRKKDEVATELPEKTEIIRTVSLQGRQGDLYETIRLAMDKKIRAEIGKKGLARSQIMILDALLKLRQVCCDPRIVSLPQASKVTQSAKLQLLMELVPEMVEEGRKILLFSQFTKMLALIETELQNRDIEYSKLTGQTRKRDEAISLFQDGKVPVFLISLKAGGVGLNLTTADTVIHYDPWWNPAVENQATDRAHRIGQNKAVFVYKLITENTVEEKIIELQQKKQALADAVYSGKSTKETMALSAEELTGLLQPII